MKRIFTMLLTVILLVSQFSAMSVFAAEVAGTQADPISEVGDTATFLASDKYQWPTKFVNTDGSDAGLGAFVMNAAVKFDFYSAKAQSVKLSVKVAPWQPSEAKTALLFFNPIATPTSSQASSMTEGVDYPAKSDAVINYTFTAYGDYYQYHLNRVEGKVYMKYSNPADWPVKEAVVDAVEGKNTVWFPNGLYSGANGNVCLYSVTVEALEEDAGEDEEEGGFDDGVEKATFYVSDIEGKEDFMYKESGDYTIQSYLGASNKQGYTTKRSNSKGNYTSIPFSVEEKGDYIVNVYYGLWYDNQSWVMDRASAMYLDQKPSQTPNELISAYSSASNSDLTYLDSYNEYRASLGLEAVEAYPDTETAQWWNFKNTTLAGFDTTKKITSANWYRTEPLGYDNDGQAKISPTMASYFRVNSFVLNDIDAGDHVATFLTEPQDSNADGAFEVKGELCYNADIMINRIEIVPVTENIKPALATYIYNAGAVASQTSRPNWANYLTSLEDANIIGTDITFGVEVTNPSSLSKEVGYNVILAYYGEGDKLLSIDTPEGSSFTVPVAAKTTVRKEFKKPIADLPEGTLKLKVFLWGAGDSLVIPQGAATVLD
ncbi:MAG: hypothetical protein E7404_00730 [Ruminococcaceae bacterium]|nr:hypothetical protein [Oscillospiraceae bacterium]